MVQLQGVAFARLRRAQLQQRSPASNSSSSSSSSRGASPRFAARSPRALAKARAGYAWATAGSRGSTSAPAAEGDDPPLGGGLLAWGAPDAEPSSPPRSSATMTARQERWRTASVSSAVAQYVPRRPQYQQQQQRREAQAEPRAPASSVGSGGGGGSSSVDIAEGLSDRQLLRLCTRAARVRGRPSHVGVNRAMAQGRRGSMPPGAPPAIAPPVAPAERATLLRCYETLVAARARRLEALRRHGADRLRRRGQLPSKSVAAAYEAAALRILGGSGGGDGAQPTERQLLMLGCTRVGRLVRRLTPVAKRGSPRASSPSGRGAAAMLPQARPLSHEERADALRLLAGLEARRMANPLGSRRLSWHVNAQWRRATAEAVCADVAAPPALQVAVAPPQQEEEAHAADAAVSAAPTFADLPAFVATPLATKAARAPSSVGGLSDAAPPAPRLGSPVASMEPPGTPTLPSARQLLSAWTASSGGGGGGGAPAETAGVAVAHRGTNRAFVVAPLSDTEAYGGPRVSSSSSFSSSCCGLASTYDAPHSPPPSPVASAGSTSAAAAAVAPLKAAAVASTPAAAAAAVRAAAADRCLVCAAGRREVILLHEAAAHRCCCRACAPGVGVGAACPECGGAVVGVVRAYRSGSAGGAGGSSAAGAAAIVVAHPIDV